MNPLKILMGVVKAAAPMAANIVFPGSGSVIGGLLTSVLPKSQAKGLSDVAKAEIVLKDPVLLAKLKTKAIDLEATLAKAKNENMAQVADTIKAELVNGRWYQRAWRPWCGFLFPVSVLLIYVGLPIFRHYTNSVLMTADVPQVLWIGWLSILGVASHGRNKEKQAAAGVRPGGLVTGLVNKFLK